LSLVAALTPLVNGLLANVSALGQTLRTTFEVGKGGLPEAFDDKRRKADVYVGDQDDDDDDDDWVDPSVPTPTPPIKIQAPAMVQNPLEQF
jgi:hypothetical protein